MTQPLSIVGVFCEDIREEGENVVTLVGLIPDNINIEIKDVSSAGKEGAVPRQSNRFLGKLCFYARANFDPNEELNSLPFFIVLPDGTRIPAGEIAKDTIEKAKSQAVEHSLPIAGVTIRANLIGFRFPKSGGLIRLETDVEGAARVVGVLSAATVLGATSSSETAQPS